MVIKVKSRDKADLESAVKSARSRRNEAKVETVVEDKKSSDRPKISKILTVRSNNVYALIDPNNGRRIAPKAVTKDVVRTNWIDVQIEAKLLEEVK